MINRYGFNSEGMHAAEARLKVQGHLSHRQPQSGFKIKLAPNPDRDITLGNMGDALERRSRGLSGQVP